LTAHKYSLPSRVWCSAGLHQPQPIRGIGAELSLYQIIVAGRARWGVLALARGDGRVDPRNAAQPPYPALRHSVAKIGYVIGEHSVPTLRAILV